MSETTNVTTTQAAGQLPQTNAAAGGQQAGADRTFTQAELDRIIGERLAREGQKYTDYEALKAKAAEYDKAVEAQKTEAQKMADKAAQAQKERDEALERSQKRLIRSAFIAEAAQAGVAHPEDAYRLADLGGVKIDDDDNVQGVAQAVKALIEGGRLVMSQRQAPGLDGGAGSGGKPQPQPAALSDEERTMARKMGVTDEQYATSKTAIQKRKQQGG